MKMLQKLKLIFGIVLYLLELALNLNAFFQHTSGCCSSVWWILPILVFGTFLVNIVTIVNRRGKISFGWYGVAFLLQLGVVLRYFEEGKMLEEDMDNDKKSRKLLRVRFTQALFNSGPQCILHGYILMETWDFPAYIIVSLVVSFMSLVWGFYSFSLSHPDLSKFGTSVLVIFKLGFIISRLVLLSFFLYFFGAFLPALFGPRVLVLQLSAYFFAFYLLCCYLCVKFWNCCGDIESFAFSVWNFTITVLASVFDITACFHGYGWMAAYHFVESAAMFCVGMWVEPQFHSDSDHIDTLRFLVMVVALGGFGVGCVFCCLASCFTDYYDSGALSLCYMYKQANTSSEAPSNSLSVRPTNAIASTSVPDDPSPFSGTAFVVRKEQFVVQGPTHAAVLERTEIYGIERC